MDNIKVLHLTFAAFDIHLIL